MHPQFVLLLVGLTLFAGAYLLKKVTGTSVFPFAMAVLTEDRNTSSRDGRFYSYQVLTGVKIYAGSLVALTAAGYARPGTVATTLKAVGRANVQIDNSAGQSGDLSVEVEEGVFRFGNSESGDAITIADIGNACFIVDDQTVAKTSGTNTRSVAGYIRDVDADGVWVEIRNIHTADGDLVAANNLSDVGSAATARANIGANKVMLNISVGTLVGTGVYRVVTPVAGKVVKIYSVIEGALTTGDATLTGKIGATPITNGAITITQAGSAAGDVDVATPTAANDVVAGDAISVTVGGTNATASTARVTVLIET